VNAASFRVDIAPDAALAFATLSGDWNPLHIDPEHAARTTYKRPVLHGAFSAGLVSRMAGMFLPGTDCLLHAMRLRFLAPIIPPASLTVTGNLVAGGGEVGTVDVAVIDAVTGMRYVDASYDFGRHDQVASTVRHAPSPAESARRSREPVVIVTGATGGVGQALLARLGDRALGVSRQPHEGMALVPDLERVAEAVGESPIEAIVHCAWPTPDNAQLTTLPDLTTPVEHHVAAPLRQMLALAQLLRLAGTPDAVLVLVGSTAAAPGRHNYRMPLYTLGKSLIPELTRILALELGVGGQRCLSVVFDVIEGGMNQRLSKSARLAHANRIPTGTLPSTDDAAGQIAWLLANKSHLVSGVVMTLSGGAMP